MNRIKDNDPMGEFLTPRTLKLAFLTYLVMGVILTFAVLKPFPLMEEADPFSPVDLDPEWYLLSAQKLLNALPGILSALVLLLIPFLFIMLPFFDRRGWLKIMSTFWRIVLIVIITICFVILTWGLGC